MASHSVMYVAKDLTYWFTNEPENYARKVTINGKEFIPLTANVVSWLKERVLKAEAACNENKITLEAFSRIVQAFCPVYEFAVTTGMIPDPRPKMKG